jgi:tetratricopeptide (TPR) repeat protein
VDRGAGRPGGSLIGRINYDGVENVSDPASFDPADTQGIDEQASILMKRGIQLMSEDRPAAASEALACFDQALDLRSGLLLDESPLLRYGLAACWLNRADALMKLGGSPQIAEAIRSCDEAVGLLQTLALADDSRYPRRLAMAHHNRGLFLQILGKRPLSDAVAAFDDALAVLQHDAAGAISDRQYLLAVVWMNLASLLAVQGTPDSEPRAMSAAMQAIELVAEVEGENPAAAEVGLKARHALCRTFAGRLAALDAGHQEMPDDVHAATDAVDDGLALIRRWEQQGVARFRMLAADLFRFGSRVYLMYQPQFLQEFLDENLDPAASSPAYVEDQDIRAAAQEIVDLYARLYT